MASIEGEIRIVLIGKTGSGKSATANTIVGKEDRKKNKFKESRGFDSDTREMQCETVCRLGKTLKVVDTPGLFENRKSQLDDHKIIEEVKKAFVSLSPGPHAIILVVSAISRYGDEDRQTADIFLSLFGEDMVTFLFVVFTGGDEFKEEDQDFDAVIRNTKQADLQTLLKKCKGRYILFDNKANDEESEIQVKKLIDDILTNVKTNGGKHFTNNLFRSIYERLTKDYSLVDILTSPIWVPFELIKKGVKAMF